MSIRPSSQISSIEPWNEATTTTKATGNTQNIYQNGKIGIGDFNSSTPATALEGAGKILTSDSNGVGTWQLPGVTIGKTTIEKFKKTT